MRFKQKNRRDAISAMKRLIHGNNKSIDERASTQQTELHRWRKAFQKRKDPPILPRSVLKCAEEMVYLEGQNQVLLDILSSLENTIGEDMKGGVEGGY